MHNTILSSDFLCNDDVLEDDRLTITQKFIMFIIRREWQKQGTPDVIALTVKTLESYGVRGHGHIKKHLNQLLKVGYLLEIGTTQRDDGYSVTAVRMNKNIQQVELFLNQAREAKARLSS